jgi:Phosphotransferase system cellobiose-specific component IIC
VPWVMPPVINAFLATGANFGAALVSLVNLVLATAIYLPFVIMANKQAEKEAAE